MRLVACTQFPRGRCCNKHLIQKVRRVLARVKLRRNLSIGWVKAHTGGTTTEALGNAAADRLAACGSRGSSSSAVLEQVHSIPRRVPTSASTDRKDFGGEELDGAWFPPGEIHDAVLLLTSRYCYTPSGSCSINSPAFIDLAM